MQQFRITALALVSMAALAACSDNPAGPAPDAITVKPVTASAVGTITVCSDANTATAGGQTWSTFTNGKNGAWAAPVGLSAWIGPTGFISPDGVSRQSDADWQRSGVATFNTTFSIPAGATGVSLSGNVSADNGYNVKLNGTSLASAGLGPYPVADPNEADFSTTPDFQTPGGNPFTGAGATFNIGASNTVSFTIDNDDYPNFGDPNASNENHAPTGNPFGLDFCYTVSYTPFVQPPPSGPVFVIGDVEAHALLDNVNFWGAQWWKNNQMSGFVSNGVAAFKGFADVADNFCGGTWTTLPGNSSKPPATLGPDVTIIVTSTVLKSGPNISGNIVEILTVHQDGGYGPNPGHAGNGPVTAITCPVGP